MGGISLRDYYAMLKARGWRYPLRYFIHSHLFDILRGTDTHFWIPPAEYKQKNINSKDSIHYVACPTHIIRKCLREIHKHAGNGFGDYQFIDLGCGKGKALLVYAEYSGDLHPPPALGIEMVEAISSIARYNINARKLDGRIKVITDSAVNWVKHSTSARVIIFLYNPFGADTLLDVISRAKLNNCYIAYVDPEHSFLLREKGWTNIYERTGEYKNDHVQIWFLETVR